MSDIQKIKDKFNALGLDFKGDLCDSPLTWLGEYILLGRKPYKDKGIEIIKWLESEFKFKFIEQYQEETFENGYSIISLNGQLYKLDYQFGSNEDIQPDDFYNWKKVTGKSKNVTIYE